MFVANAFQEYRMVYIRNPLVVYTSGVILYKEFFSIKLSEEQYVHMK